MFIFLFLKKYFNYIGWHAELQMISLGDFLPGVKNVLSTTKECQNYVSRYNGGLKKSQPVKTSEIYLEI